ncbi:D-hexose-6-phosphate mutarotase [Ornithinimicrobium tianjinense]|uniref:Putative glucose-6-phosphate 1-epimerase n=1 Tax=Ornithinimicrobium tianjinense TaxID=1195761 RepID=A0A917BKE5_9MICO|nr:D-hexose-6-phosphate mutarotase [Ornithinimicrobium tianjinense]GGF47305.1 D-hexose-6-phosphate mutarotase [Ornithinimicrobium tianjinense]
MTTLTPLVHERDGHRLVAYDHGAHLAEWRVDGHPVVWLSPHAVLDGSAAIRGGVPLCFPWFGAGPEGDRSPSHGLVRTVSWHQDETDGEEVWAWTLSSEELDGETGAEHLEGPFDLRYAVSLLPRSAAGAFLRLELTVTNPSPVPLHVEAALHSYLAVADVRTVRVEGLDGAAYLDKVSGTRHVQDGDVTLHAETDRVYDTDAAAGLVVLDDGRALTVQPEGATQVVVWNPWETKAARMTDLPEDAWHRFVCVEAAATGCRGLVVQPLGSTRLACTIGVSTVSDGERLSAP